VTVALTALRHKKFFKRIEERGQARLPDPELISVYFDIRR